jgi:flagellar hook-basal body complex protein FliE
MSLPIVPVSPVIPAITTPTAQAAGGSPFSSVLTDAIQKVEAFQSSADQSVNRFLSGEGEELHQVALKTQQADLSFQLFMQVRNKVVAAYQEVMRMQI